MKGASKQIYQTVAPKLKYKCKKISKLISNQQTSSESAMVSQNRIDVSMLYCGTASKLLKRLFCEKKT